MSFPQITSPPQAQAEVVVNEIHQTLEHQRVYGQRHAAHTGLTWGYHGGMWGGFSIADGTLVLDSATTVYGVVAVASGVHSKSTSITNWNNTTDYVRVYKWTTGASTVTSYEDHRAGSGGVHGTGPGGAALTDGDKGDITVSSAGAVWTIDANVISTFGRTLTDDANQAAAQTTLGVVPGADVQAYDAELAALAGLTSAADKVPYFTGSGAAAVANFTAAGRALVDDATAGDQRTTLSAAARSQTDECMSWLFAVVADGTFLMVVNIPHAGTITDVTTKAAAGTATLTVKVNSTALGGTANSISTSESTQSHSSTNTFAAADDINLTFSSSSACTFATVTVKYTRTLL